MVTLIQLDVRFYCLMQHDVLPKKYVFAQIHVHSKVMISDTKAIVGSGNINYRRYDILSSLPPLSTAFLSYFRYSLDGTGDTEIGVVVTSRAFDVVGD